MKMIYRGWYYYAAAGVLLATLPAKCHAQLYTWNNPAGGSFSSPGNWSPNGLPGSTGLTQFNLSNSYTVNFDYSPTNVGTIVNNGDVTFNIGVGNTYALASPISSAIGTTAGYSPSLTVTSGALHFNTAQGDTGGPDSTGIATAAGGSGTLTITGSNSQLLALQVFDVGVAGTGTINALNKAYVRLGNNSYLGVRAGSSGNLYANDSTIELGSGIVVGNAGVGEIVIRNQSSAFFGPDLTLGKQSGSIGSMTIGSIFDPPSNSSAYTYGAVVGNSGVGIVNIANGVLFNRGELAVAKNLGSNGTITISNFGTLIQQDGMIYLGGSSTGQGGPGVITIHTGGKLYADYNNTNGITLLPNGTLNILTGGDVYAYLVKSTSFNGTVNLVGGRLNVGSGGMDYRYGRLQVNGELNITNGEFKALELRVGNGATGSVQVNGGPSGIDDIWVGSGTNGTGSFYMNTYLSANRLYIGSQGGTGTMTFDGVANPYVDQESFIGVGGKGTLNIKRSTVLDEWGRTVLGASGGTGVVNNEGIWNQYGGMEIGKSSFYAPGLAQSATLNILSGSMNIQGGLLLYSPGTINFNGGLLSMDSLAPQGGVINFNEGTIRFTNQWNADYNQLTTILGASHKLRNGQVIEVQDATTLQSFLELNGGILRTGSLNGGSNLNFKSGQLQLTASNFIVGGGSSTLGSTVTLGPNQQLAVNQSSIIVENDGLLQIAGGYASAADVINHGEIQLAGSTSRLGLTGPPYSLFNTGRISGTGRILSNLNNNPNGRIIVDAGQRLVFSGDSNYNGPNGTIELSGGTLEFTKTLTNELGGFISGRGTFRGSSASTTGVGLINNGSVAFSAGVSDVYGKVINNPGGRIITAGAGTVTFHDDMVHNGTEIRTGFGSRTVILGSASGAGPFTGTGTVEFQGDLRPGNSPANVYFDGSIEIGASATTHFEITGYMPGSEYDRLTVAGAVILDGTLHLSLSNSFLPEFNSQFMLIDNTGSGPIIGTFSNLPEGTLFMADGQQWTISYKGGTGNDLVLTAVPEPATWALMGLTIAGSGWYGYRRIRNRENALDEKVPSNLERQ